MITYRYAFPVDMDMHIFDSTRGTYLLSFGIIGLIGVWFGGLFGILGDSETETPSADQGESAGAEMRQPARPYDDAAAGL